MKKSLIIALGAIALVACTKTSVSYEQTGEIGFAPVVRKNSTKAAVEGTEFPNQNIKVFGYYDNSMAVGSSYSAGKFAVEYLPGVEFAKNGAIWAGANNNHYYWPKTGSILFAGYSPADFGVVTFSLENNIFSVAQLEQPEFYPTIKDLGLQSMLKQQLKIRLGLPTLSLSVWRRKVLLHVSLSGRQPELRFSLYLLLNQHLRFRQRQL